MIVKVAPQRISNNELMELKAGEFTPGYVGKFDFYLSAAGARLCAGIDAIVVDLEGEQKGGSPVRNCKIIAESSNFIIIELGRNDILSQPRWTTRQWS